jgi:hypothetical protein
VFIRVRHLRRFALGLKQYTKALWCEAVLSSLRARNCWLILSARRASVIDDGRDFLSHCAFCDRSLATLMMNWRCVAALIFDYIFLAQ